MLKKIFILLLLPISGLSQVQIGNDILGDGNWSNVALSSYGNIVALSDSNQGSATKVYEDISGVWTQIGQNIPMRGFAVSLSSFGNIVAIGDNMSNNVNGAVAGITRVYEFDMGIWKQKGQSIDGKSVGEQSGFSVSLSSNGNTLAIGAPYKAWQGDADNPSGTVRVYNYSNLSGTWNQVGADIDGQGFGFHSGTSVSLSANGNVLAVGTIFEATTGVVRIYSNTNGVWTQIGNTIHGEGNSDRFGRSISLSSDGTILAVGGYLNSGNGTDAGHVRIYHNISGVWVQIGNDIDGQSDHDQLGIGVSLSADGKTIAIGALMQVPPPLTPSGTTRIYKNISNVWTKVHNDINFGYFVSLSSGGERVATKKNGVAKVFDLKIASNNTFTDENFTIYPNPATDIFNISLSDNIILEKVTIYNNLGHLIKTSNDKVINVDNLSSGIYFVEVSTNQGKAVKKIIVK